VSDIFGIYFTGMASFMLLILYGNLKGTSKLRFGLAITFALLWPIVFLMALYIDVARWWNGLLKVGGQP